MNGVIIFVPLLSLSADQMAKMEQAKQKQEEQNTTCHAKWVSYTDIIVLEIVVREWQKSFQLQVFLTPNKRQANWRLLLLPRPMRAFEEWSGRETVPQWQLHRALRVDAGGVAA